MELTLQHGKPANCWLPSMFQTYPLWNNLGALSVPLMQPDRPRILTRETQFTRLLCHIER